MVCVLVSLFPEVGAQLGNDRAMDHPVLGDIGLVGASSGV
jgi:hypothetical protein